MARPRIYEELIRLLAYQKWEQAGRPHGQDLEFWIAAEKEFYGQTSGIVNWMKQIGGLRDGFLVIASVLYILGYIIWSVSAFQSDLGLLPAIESQYFIAGIVPTLILWLVYIGVIYGRRLPEKLPKFPNWGWLGTGREWWEVLVRWVVYSLFWVSLAGVFTSERDWFEKVFPWLEFSKVNYILTFVITSLIFSPLTQPKTSRFSMIFYAYYLPIMAGAILIILYMNVIYPNFPQEFGGVRPRCAYLDVVKTQVSNETFKDLLPVDAIRSNSQVVRSIRVDMLFSGGDIILVAPRTEKREANPKTYEIRRSVVQAVTWCGQSGG